MRVEQRHGLILAVTLALVGCAVLPRIDVARDPQADFSSYRTFTFHDPLGTDRGDGTRTVLSQTLKQATRSELEALGYRYVEAGDADLEVNFFVETREVVEGLRRPDPAFRYSYFHRHYGVWSDYGTTEIRQYTEGTRHIDVVEAARRQLVWEGLARGRLSEADFTVRSEEVAAAVRSVFARFPRQLAAD
jgi:hypothetical protein